MFSTVFIGVLTALGEFLGLDHNQSLFATTVVYPVLTPGFLGLAWVLAQDLFGRKLPEALSQPTGAGSSLLLKKNLLRTK